MPSMNGRLTIAILLITLGPTYVQAQQLNTAKLREDAQKVVSTVRSDKAKTQAYCQINSLGGQRVEAAQEKDSEKAEALFERVDDLEKQLDPQYRALFDALTMLTPIPKMFRISCRCSI